MSDLFFHSLVHVEKEIELPERFTFPFYYEPHPLSLKAVEIVQNYLETQSDFDHNFGLKENQAGLVIGKMFGVLVVKNKLNELGFLAAFSGKLANANHHAYFVPPLFDMLEETGFFRTEERQLTAINLEIEKKEKSADFEQAKIEFSELEETAKQELTKIRLQFQVNRKNRKQERQKGKLNLAEAEFETLIQELNSQSIADHYFLKDETKRWKKLLEIAHEKLSEFSDQILALKEERKERSAALQQKLFEQYRFLDARLTEKSLLQIFEVELQKSPISGAGECAAPKLLQHAFKNGYQIISMAEFWWGASPASEIRQHKHFYPACKSKCEPILGHMLKGVLMDKNVLKEAQYDSSELEVLFEDEFLMAINKPAEMLSVPGKTPQLSVYSILHEKYPQFTGPLLVHRLDMSTSGILLIAKTKEIHFELQKQFINRTINKRYVALLDGKISEKQGEINLPLRVDLEDRPRQLVCFEHGKNAKTKWVKISDEHDKTRIHFYPITGRTHQLRVHAAHQFGLNAPILGDDLYGKKANRLHLHAELLKFTHPISGKIITVKSNTPF